jgi:hypothetical protein
MEQKHTVDTKTLPPTLYPFYRSTYPHNRQKTFFLKSQGKRKTAPPTLKRFSEGVLGIETRELKAIRARSWRSFQPQSDESTEWEHEK